MRGASSFVALSALAACALAFSPASASDLGAVRALAREKAAAVSLLKARASNKAATLAQDRVFIAYLNASTQGEGARLRQRMATMFTTLWNRFGVREVALVDRSGVLVVRVGNTRNAPATFDAKNDPVLAAGFAQARFTAATVAGEDALTIAAPVVWRKQAEFVLSVRQELTAYRRTLAHGTPGGAFVILVDAKGRVVADTREAAKAGKLVAGLSLDQLRRAVKGARDEGAGEVARGGERLYVSYRKTGDWTIVAGAPASAPRRCRDAGQRLCG